MARPLFFFAPLFFVLSGCQHAAWKAGASADDFKRDELACRTANSDDAAVSQCLRDKGWSLANFDIPTDETAEQTAESASAPAREAASPPLTENVRNTTKDNPQQLMAKKPNSGVSPNQKVAAPTDPLQRQSVQTWWKAGAQAADFQIDAERCLTQLGEQHTPDYAKHVYTRALVNCLRESGWYAGRDPVYTPLR